MLSPPIIRWARRPSRNVPASGALARRITTTRVVTDDRQHAVPASLTVSGPQAVTASKFDGSRLSHDVSYGDGQFTAEGLKDGSVPQAGP